MRKGPYMISIQEVLHELAQIRRDLARCTDEGVEEVLRDDLVCFESLLEHELYNAN